MQDLRGPNYRAQECAQNHGSNQHDTALLENIYIYTYRAILIHFKNEEYSQYIIDIQLKYLRFEESKSNYTAIYKSNNIANPSATGMGLAGLAGLDWAGLGWAGLGGRRVGGLELGWAVGWAGLGLKLTVYGVLRKQRQAISIYFFLEGLWFRVFGFRVLGLRVLGFRV